MNTVTATIPTSTETYQIGTFVLAKNDRKIVSKALKIAKKMRGKGDGKLEDTARAMILIRGAGLVENLTRRIKATDDADLDRQTVAYMDGVAELGRKLPNF